MVSILAHDAEWPGTSIKYLYLLCSSAPTYTFLIAPFYLIISRYLSMWYELDKTPSSKILEKFTERLLLSDIPISVWAVKVTFTTLGKVSSIILGFSLKDPSLVIQIRLSNAVLFKTFFDDSFEF